MLGLDLGFTLFSYSLDPISSVSLFKHHFAIQWTSLPRLIGRRIRGTYIKFIALMNVVQLKYYNSFTFHIYLLYILYRERDSRATDSGSDEVHVTQN